MTFRDFFAEIPRAGRIAAAVLGGSVALAGVAAAVANRDDSAHAVLLYSLAGVVGGLMLATWILGVGFVYADARRRAMRPVLWAVLVVLFPHLLGFLLYFVMRQPLPSVCGRCGHAISEQQRFCSWCGAAQTAPLPVATLSAQDRTEGGTR